MIFFEYDVCSNILNQLYTYICSCSNWILLKCLIGTAHAFLRISYELSDICLLMQHESCLQIHFIVQCIRQQFLATSRNLLYSPIHFQCINKVTVICFCLKVGNCTEIFVNLLSLLKRKKYKICCLLPLIFHETSILQNWRCLCHVIYM